MLFKSLNSYFIHSLQSQVVGHDIPERSPHLHYLQCDWLSVPDYQIGSWFCTVCGHGRIYVPFRSAKHCIKAGISTRKFLLVTSINALLNPLVLRFLNIQLNSASVRGLSGWRANLLFLQ